VDPACHHRRHAAAGIDEPAEFLGFLKAKGFGHFQIAGLALLYLKNSTKAEIESDLGVLVAEPEQDDSERTRRERLLEHVRSNDHGDALQMAKYGLENARILPTATRGAR